MARPIAARLQITGTLVAQGPLHIGGMGGDTDVDLALAEDGKGRLYLPGTSLAGPLRAWLHERVTDKSEVDNLFGFQRKEQQTNTGIASHIFIEDGLVTLPAGAEIETRDGVGINRFTGTAAEGFKYNRAVLPSGTKVELRMTVEIAAANTTAQQMRIKGLVGALLQALQNGRIRFGAAKSRGLGCVRCETAPVVIEQQLLTRAGMLQALRQQSSGIPLPVANLHEIPQLEFRLTWHPDGPLMVKAERDGLAVDMLPLTSAIDGQWSFVLPGSSIKGALRTQAERILRTIDQTLPVPSPDDFAAQLNIPFINALFGTPATGEVDEKKLQDEEKGEALPGLSALFIEDCYALPATRFTAAQWEKVEAVPDSVELLKALQKANLSNLQQAFHVAIDRWTGGAADGFLYNVLEPHGVAWSEIILKLDLGRLPESQHRAAIACVLMLLRDFAAGRIPLGFAVNRGMGAVKLDQLAITAHDTKDTWFQKLEGVGLADGNLAGLAPIQADLKQAWQPLVKPAPVEGGQPE